MKTSIKLLSLFVVLVLATSCQKPAGMADSATTEALTLASSVFNEGEAAPDAEDFLQERGLAMLDTGTDGGFIPGGGSNPNGGDGGSIPAPGSGGTTTPPSSGGNNGGSTTPTTPGGSTGGGTADNGGTVPAPGGGETPTTPGGTDGGSANNGGSTQPGSNDGGSIPGGSANNGNDGGNTNPPAGGGSTPPDNGGSTTPDNGGGTIPGGGVADNGGSSGGGSTTPGGNNNGGTDNGGTTPGGSNGGNDGGGIADNGSSNGGNDGGSTNPGGGTTPGGNDGGSSNPGGGVADNGGTTPDGGSGNNSGGGTTPGGNDNGGSTPGGGVADNGGNSGGSTTPGNDGGAIPGGNNNGGGTDGGNTNPSNPGGGVADNGGTTPNPGGGNTTPDNGGGTNPGGGVADNGGTTPGGNNNGGGTDGGTTPDGNNNGGGTDGGTTPGGGVADNDDPTDPTDPSTPDDDGDDNSCQPKKFKVVLSRVCSVRRSNSDYLFFEEAKHPILSFEAAWATKESERKYHARVRNLLASIGFGAPKVQSKMVQTAQGKLRYLVASFDLSKVDLFKGKYSQQLDLALNKLKDEFSSQWKKSVINVAVCDDKDKDGYCSDEKDKNQLAVEIPKFKAKALPSTIQIDVWNGRYLTKGDNPDKCEMQYSPLVLDLQGNGIQLAGPEAGAEFDLNDTGEEVRTGWVAGRDDALLARDLNKNGKIDSGAELFGSATKLSTGARAANGFEALKELDSDLDGLITPKDKAWKELVLWLDLNHDGRTDKKELVSLETARLSSIKLNYVNMLEVDKFGNETRQRSVYTRKINGKDRSLLIVDVWFTTLVEN